MPKGKGKGKGNCVVHTDFLESSKVIIITIIDNT